MKVESLRRFIVTGMKKEESRHGSGVFFQYIFFKDEEGTAYKTHIDPRMGNASRWKPVVERGVGGTWEGLNLWSFKMKIIDADSFPKEVK